MILADLLCKDAILVNGRIGPVLLLTQYLPIIPTVLK